MTPRRRGLPLEPPDDVVIVLSYYAPYTSGLTDFAREVGEGLVNRGRRVTVVATQHDPKLPRTEYVNGVRVLRAPVIGRFGKGVLSPSLPLLARRAMRNARVANLHLPLVEAGLLSTRMRTPVVVTYHCDISLPPGLSNRAQTRVVDWSSRAAMRSAAVVAATSEDYATHSRLAVTMLPKLKSIPPPCRPVADGRPTYRDGAGLHIGFLGRIVAEKGLEHLVDAFRRLPSADARLLIGGDYLHVAGGSVVEDIKRRIGGDRRIALLGFLPDRELPNFYASLDLFALPSVNAFEAFGIVQVVAMQAGIPVVASDLPGVRVPVRTTGFGQLVRPGNASDLFDAIVALEANPPDRSMGARAAREAFGLDATLDAYDALLEDVSEGRPAIASPAAGPRLLQRRSPDES